MALESKILRQIQNEDREWRGEINVLLAIMQGKAGTNAQRNTLRRIIRQNSVVLNNEEPALIFSALNKIGELSRIKGLMGDAKPKAKLGQFVNQ